MKISIITICRNAELSIEKTIQSVVGQTYLKIQYVIIDGKSNDKTLDIVEKYKKNISKIVSESDKGIYDAMNKGIKLATGDIIYFLNAGDKIHNSKVIENVVRKFKENNCDLLYGNVLLFEGNKKSPTYYKNQDNIDELFLVNDNVCHQSIFAKKNLFKKYGFFDLDFPICADFKWFLKLFLEKKVIKKHIDLVVADYLLGGVSSNETKFKLEHYRILSQYFTTLKIIFYKLLSKTRSKSRYYTRLEKMSYGKKRILLISPSSGIGGAESVLLGLIEGLKERYELYLLIHRGNNRELFNNKEVKNIYTTKLFNGAIETNPSLLNLLILPIGIIKNYFYAIRIIRKDKIDLIITNSGTVFYPALAARKCKIKNFTIFHEKIESEFWRKIFFRINNRFSQNIIFVSKFLMSQFPFSLKSVVIGPGLPEKIRQKLSKINKINKINKQKLIVGNVGTIYSTKGTDIFVDSAIEACSRSKNISFKVYGNILDKGYYNEMQKRIKASGFSNRINFIGRKQTEEIFSEIDLLVVSSRFETYGLATIESLTSSVPVISFDVGIAGEVIENGKNGYLIKNRDTNQIASKCLILEADRDKLQIMSKNAHQSLIRPVLSFSEYIDQLMINS